MSRIFSTRFFFNHQLYDALITMIVKDGKINFTIKVLDMDLHNLIPDGELQYEGKDGFKNLDLMQNELANSLVLAISSAIEDHLITADTA